MKNILFLLAILFLNSFVDGKTWIRIHVYNGTQTGPSGYITNYTISSGDSLRVKAWKYSTSYVDSNIIVNWYLDSVYQFTAGGMVTFNQPGLITTSPSTGSAVQLTVVTGINNLSSSTLPFPFSQSSNININNLLYTIVNPLGQIIEQGNFSGEIILRNGNHSLQPGIYFVIYSDALDNRQVLTDKVFVSNQ